MTTALSTTAAVVPLRVVKADEHPVRVYLAGLGEASRRPMRHGLEVISCVVSGGRHDADSLPWATLRCQHVEAIRTELASRYAPATASLFMSALKGVLRACWRLGYLDADQYQRTIDVKPIRGDSDNDDDRAGRSLEYREAKALFAACASDPTAVGRRDAALLGVLWCCGLRRAEVVQLTLDDATLGSDSARLRVHGKGNRTRSAYVTGGALDALREWLMVRGDHAGALFHPVKQGGNVQRDCGMSAQAVYARLRTIGRRAGVDAFSPHDLRRSFVGDMLDSGVDLSTVQKLAGHAGVNTTQRYDRRGAEVKLAAAQRRRTPFVAPKGT